MAVVSDIEIRLRADIARLQQDMDRARREVSSTMSNITSVVKGAMGALAAIGGIAAFAGFIKSAIDATDAVSDISQRTGVAIKDIAGLQLWFQIGGAEAGEFESSMIKLSKAIATNGDAFKRIGVSTREANGALRSNVDVIRDSADALAKMQDGTAKTALAIELFGKSGATLIPVLNSGSQGLQEMTEMAEKLGLTYDEKVVEQAGKFNDTLDFLGLAAQGVGRQVAAQLLPSLNSLAGSFLKFITQSDAIKKSCAAIVVGFKSIYTVGVTVYGLFETLGKIIGGSLALITTSLSTLALGLKQAIEGDYSKAWQTLTSGAQASTSILKSTFSDVKNTVSATATTIGEVWTDTGGEAIEALAAINKQSKHVSEEERKELEKRAAAWAHLKRTLDESVVASAREAAGLEPLNAAQKALLDLTEDLRQGKIKLTAEQVKSAKQSIAEWEANIAEKNSKDALEKSSEALYEIKKKEDGARKAVIDAAREETEENEKLVATFGMTEAAIASLEVARLKEQLAQRASVGLTLDEIEQLETLIELKERSAKAVANREQLEQAKNFWTDIEKTAHDTFVSIADGGKNAFQRLKETAKNTFFDWLYQQTIKKWIINIQTNGAQGALSSLTSVYSKAGGGAIGLFEAGKTLFSGFSQNLSKGLGDVFTKLGSTFGSKAATSFGSSISSSASAGGITAAIVAGMMANNKFYDDGWRIDGQVGDIIKSQLSSMFKGNGFAPITAIMTASMASFEKILGGLGVNGKFASMLSGSAVFARAFGRKAPSIEAQGLQGTISAGGFNGNLFADILEKGGWFRSDKRSTQTQALATEQQKAFDDTIKAMAGSVRGFAEVLGLQTGAIDGYNKQIKLTFGKDEAENQKMIQEAFAGLGDDLAAAVYPALSTFQQAGETTSATLQRLATGFQVVDAVLASLGSDSQTAFGAVGSASIAARERLIGFAGGVEALAVQADFFTQNFLTDAERIAPIQKEVNAQLGALGLAGITTTEQFKTAVQTLLNSGALATEQGAKDYAQLLALAPKFKAVADYLKELNDAAEEAAAKLAEVNKPYLEQIREMERSLMSATDRRLAEIAGMDASTVALHDRLAVLREENALLDLNKGYRDQIRELERSLMSANDRRLDEIAGMDASTVALYDHLAALNLEVEARDQAAERARAIADEAKALQDQYDELTMTSAELADKAKKAIDPANRARYNEIKAIEAQRSASEIAATAIQAAAASAAAAMQSLGGAVVDAMTRAQNAAKAIRDFSASLNLGGLSALDPDARYREAKKQFEAAKAEDTEAAQAFLQASKDRGADSFYYDQDFAMVQAKLASGARRLEAYAASLPAFYASLSQPPQVIIPPTFPLFDEIKAQQAGNTAMDQTAVVDLLQSAVGKLTQLADQFDNASDGGQALKTV